MTSRLKEMNVEVLFEAVLRLKTMEECYNFFEDLWHSSRAQGSFSALTGCIDAFGRQGIQRHRR